MTERKNIWVEKSDQNYHHYNTSLKENIVQMFLRSPQEKIFGAEKRSFISSFFLPFKRGQKNDWFELSSSAIFLSVQGSLGWWRNMVACPGCLLAILVFLLKTTSFVSWPAEAIVISIQLYQLEPDYSSNEEAEEELVDSGEEEVSWFRSSIEH